MEIGYARIELHLSTSPELAKKYGRAIKNAKGEYRAVRGMATNRIVLLPAGAPVELINKLVAEFHRESQTVIMLRDCKKSHIERTGDQTEVLHVQYAKGKLASEMIQSRYDKYVELCIKQNKPINQKVYHVCFAQQKILEYTAVKKNAKNSYMVSSHFGRVVVGPFGTIDEITEAGSHSGHLHIHDCYETLDEAKAVMKKKIEEYIEATKKHLETLRAVMGQC